ncbi:MBL fold metallo-hydrolase [Myroides odoratimimus]|uniref:MBL fold metallo-hydrolase n=1 Tax=Myroides odoratimimus TaxID=76832 RepID=UPI002578B3DF|nr:MBL fold metallo-hydrolase [Myroides odoratimimus]MDM1328667.1 MBL fold metallo-hydrolase [Myroides odoratimimus]
MFKANYGDTILVRIENEKHKYNLLIDCGFGYKDGLLNYIQKNLKNEVINKFIITHYDNDHIASASKFLEDNGDYNNPKLVHIEQIWLNTFKYLQFSKRSDVELTQEATQNIQKIIASKTCELKTDSNEGDIGAKQALLLGKTILKNNYPWNIDSNGKAICVENIQEAISDGPIKITLLTPSKQRLEILENEFIRELNKLGLEPNSNEIFDDAFELLSRDESKGKSTEGNISAGEYVINSNTIKTLSQATNYVKDDAIGNGSSISFILEAEGKKMLFLADAFAEDIVTRLKKLYPNKKEYPVYFDLVKVSHHGSFRNNSSELYKIIDSDKFLFSTNGNHPSHKHPDMETISIIINRVLPKGTEFRELIFNYDLGHLKDFKKEELEKEFKYKIKTQLLTEL